MEWYLSLFLSITVFVCTIIPLIISKKKKIRLLNTRTYLLAGVIISSVILLYPIYLHIYSQDKLAFLESLFASAHTTIRMFVVDGELEFISENITAAPECLYYPYFIYASVLFIIAPMLSIGLVLSFFGKLRTGRVMYQKRKLPMFVFSELNDRSLILADSIAESHKKVNAEALIVFTGTKNENNSHLEVLKNKAHENNYLCCDTGIASMNFSIHSPESRLCFFAISKDEKANTENGLTLISKYGSVKNTELYVFSKGKDAELLFSNVDAETMIVRRINEIRSFIYHHLYNNGYNDIFRSALPCEKGKKISAIVVGLNELGCEYAKTLAWFGQMDGYKLEINVFASGRNAVDRFMLKCPELLSNEYNNNFTDDGDAQYNLNIYENIDFLSDSFYNAVAVIADASYILVSCGKDELNVKVAAELRTRFERINKHPIIQAIIIDNAKKSALEGIKNYSGKEYNIQFIGDAESLYTVDVIMNSELEKTALERHKKWGREKDFWLYEYNYKSSLASALHKKMKILCGIPGADLPPDQREYEDKVKLRKLEHRRWNAYMRSEGFVYSGSCEKSSRNTLAKNHNCLVTFNKLTLEEQEKDDD